MIELLSDYLARKRQRSQRRAENVRFIRRSAKLRGDGELIRPKLSIVKRQLDDLFSIIVRQRDRRIHFGYCLVCWTKRELGFSGDQPRPIECCYHILPRADTIIRWHPHNGIGACGPCNQGELWSRASSKLRARYREIHSAIIGLGNLVELEQLALVGVKPTLEDLIDKREEFKKVLAGERPMPLFPGEQR